MRSWVCRISAVVLASVALWVTGVLVGDVVPASAAKVVTTNARWVSLSARANGVAMVTYYQRGRTYHVLAWGGKNARSPSRTRRQVHFHLSYAGGYGSFLGRGYWRTVRRNDVCGPYRGPRLWRMVTACTMPDGSSWALQRWQADLPDNGWKPRGRSGAYELFLSHWSGPLPKLWFKAGWTYAGAQGGPFDMIYGQFTYRGNPVFGYRATARGAPTDSYSRLIALDAHRPPWSGGFHQPDGYWRQNSFLVHRPYGDFCSGVFRRIAGVRSRSVPGRGTAYRIVANGPGVTPVVEWSSAPPGYYQPGLSNLVPMHRTRGPYSATLNKALQADQRLLDPVPNSASSCFYTH